MILIDTNVIIDVLSGDPRHAARSAKAIAAAAAHGAGVGPVVYAELAGGVPSRPALDGALAALTLRRIELTDEGLFLAGRAFAAYRARGGPRTSMLADFLVAAQAAALGASLLTRDPRRHTTAFPQLALIEP